MRIAMVGAALLLCAACGGSDGAGDDAPAAGVTESNASSDQGRVQISTRLDGTLYFNFAAPLEAPRAMALDLKSKRYSVVADGIHPNVQDDAVAYINFCSPLQVQLAVTDADGFMSPLSECVERDSFNENSLQGPAISPDGQRVAILNHELYRQVDADDPDAYLNLLGGDQYSALQVYDLDGELLAEFPNYGPATWTKDGDLIMAGRGGDAGYGLFKADKDLSGAERLDDGRLKSNIDAIDAHPKRDRVSFIFNGAVFEMGLKEGKPKRLHAHGNLLAGVTYSPDGDQIAFISVDTLDEAFQMSGSGYPIFVYDDGDIHTIRMPFVVAGPLDWTE